MNYGDAEITHWQILFSHPGVLKKCTIKEAITQLDEEEIQ